jgi:uncharacterized protein (TIGR00369 family)
MSYDQFRDFFDRAIPFNVFLGMRLAEMRDCYARLELPFRPEFIGDARRPALHGGVISSLIDTAGGAATFTKISADDYCSTIDLRVDYLLPGSPELICAEATVLRIGNRVSAVDIRAFHPSAPDRTVATGKGVYSVYRRGER